MVQGQVHKLEEGPLLGEQGFVGAAAQQPVEHGHGLGPGHRGVGLEGAVLKAGEPALADSLAQGGVGPVVLLHVGELGGQVQFGRGLLGQEPGEDRGELSPGDGALGLEGAVLVAGEHPQGGQGVYITLIPMARFHVGEGVFLPGGGVFQQGVEHFGGLRPGHAVVGADFVLVALQVDHVLLGVEHRQL